MSSSPSNNDAGPGKERVKTKRLASKQVLSKSQQTDDEEKRLPNVGLRASVREVAAAADVSIGTVSRYLNGHSLLQETRVKVEQAIRKTQYEKIPSTIIPKAKKTLIIGAVFPNFDLFHANMLSFLEKLLHLQGYHVMASDYEHEESTMKEKISLLRSRGVDGIVCSPVKSTFSVLRGNIVTGLPVVTLNNRVDAWGNDHVGVDDRIAMELAVKYLLDMGHNRVAIIGGDPGTTTGWNRLQGYRDALRIAGIAERREYMTGGYWPSGIGSIDQVKGLFQMKSPPSAIVAANYKLGYNVLRYCRNNGLRIPDDISVISFDDTDLFEVHNPPITVIRQPIDQIAEEVVRLLFQRIGGNYETYPELGTISTEMILRESVKKVRHDT